MKGSISIGVFLKEAVSFVYSCYASLLIWYFFQTWLKSLSSWHIPMSAMDKTSSVTPLLDIQAGGIVESEYIFSASASSIVSLISSLAAVTVTVAYIHTQHSQMCPKHLWLLHIGMRQSFLMLPLRLQQTHQDALPGIITRMFPKTSCSWFGSSAMVP